MNKTILMVVSLLALVFTSVLKAEVSLSGYQEFFAGSADQATAMGDSEHGIDKSGMSNGNYGRITATGSATLDSGIEVGAYYNMARNCRGTDTNNCGVAVNGNGLTFSGNFGSIGVGEIFDVGAGMYSRQTAANPVAEPDGGMLSHFYTADASNEYGAGNETNYAQNDMKIKYNSNVYSGFSFAMSYSPNSASKATASGDDGSQNSYVADKLFNDITHFVGKYSTEMDGVGIEVAYGQLTGNAGRIGTVDYNDLEETVYSAAISYAGVKVDYRKNEADNSGEVKNGTAGNDEGTSICATYSMANIGLGACQVETSFIDTSNLSNESKTRTYSADYNLGGGAKIGIVYFDAEQTANSVTRTDADGLVSKLSFGF